MTFAIYIHTLCLTESLLHLGEYKIFSDINACSKRSVLDRLMKKSLQKLNCGAADPSGALEFNPGF
jgi:hypothetical protein